MRGTSFALSLAAVALLAGCAARSASRQLGSVTANARIGYDSATALFPLLAGEARKMGANAVINAAGGHRVTAFSWGAADVHGTAVKLKDPEQLKGLPGTYH